MSPETILTVDWSFGSNTDALSSLQTARCCSSTRLPSRELIPGDPALSFPWRREPRRSKTLWCSSPNVIGGVPAVSAIAVAVSLCRVNNVRSRGPK
jgi:hypothetical protein